MRVVEFLSRHPQVERVNHPSLSGHPDHKLYEKYFPKGAASIFTFEIKGKEKEAQAFIDHLELFSLLDKFGLSLSARPQEDAPAADRPPVKDYEDGAPLMETAS